MTDRPEKLLGGPDKFQRLGGSSGNGGNRLSERLVAVETTLKYVATKEDIQRVETLIEAKETKLLKWLVSLVVVGIFSIIAAIITTALS